MRNKFDISMLPTIQALFALAGAVMLIGCAGTQGIGSGPDRTGGISVALVLEHADGSAAYYHVMADGSIGYGGAHDARRREFSWTGRLTDEQIDELRQILLKHDLLTDEPAVEDDREQPSYRVDIRSPAGRNRFRLSGSSPPVDELHRHLREIALQRFDHVLETLPQPET